MKIGGIQRLTLLDYPGKVACTVFTVGCNLRCPFCHNASLVTHTQDAESYSVKELMEYLQKRKGMLDGVCISGGEPLLQGDIEDVIRDIKALGYSVKLDTNGTFPEKLEQLINKGLIDYVAMDVKNCEEKYAVTAGLDSIDISKIKKSISILMEGKVDFEFRTTVVNELHTPSDIKKLAGMISGAEKYFIQPFLHSPDLIVDGLSAVQTQDLVQMKQFSELFVESVKIRGVDTTS